MTTPNSTTEAGCALTPAERQSWELHIEQADAIRELLDKYAPETEGNLQNRIAHILQSRPSAQGGAKCKDCGGSGIDGDCGNDGQSIDVACASCKGTGVTPPATSGMKDSLVGDAERLDVAAIMEKIPTVARLYYTGLATRRYRRASTMAGPGEPLVHRSHVERELNLIAAIRAGKKG